MSFRNVLLIYTGGTIGSMEDSSTGLLRPVNFSSLEQFIPELSKLSVRVGVEAFPAPKDSSDFRPEDWVSLVNIIERNYGMYDGFVILHGTDTLSYTASALSFMLQGLNKPVILTGSQLPIGKIRTDGKENLVTAIEIAGEYRNDLPVVPEVAVYFEYKLYRGNRCYKHSASHFNAYCSPNYPLLAEAGVSIRYFDSYIGNYDRREHPTFVTQLNPNVFVFNLFPGISKQSYEIIPEISGLHTVILQSYGFGNGPFDLDFYAMVEACLEREIVLFNISQCRQGGVKHGVYATSGSFDSMGIISGKDCLLESAVAKAMVVGGSGLSFVERQEMMRTPLCGEMSAE
jgi:L-asparaginase